MSTDNEIDELETVDAVARAAHLWVRPLCRDEALTKEEQYAVANGLVAGLCEDLELSEPIREMVAYVYSLLDYEGSEALAVSRQWLGEPVPKSMRGAYEKGKVEALCIGEVLRRNIS